MKNNDIDDSYPGSIMSIIIECKIGQCKILFLNKKKEKGKIVVSSVLSAYM